MLKIDKTIKVTTDRYIFTWEPNGWRYTTKDINARRESGSFSHTTAFAELFNAFLVDAGYEVS